LIGFTPDAFDISSIGYVSDHGKGDPAIRQDGSHHVFVWLRLDVDANHDGTLAGKYRGDSLTQTHRRTGNNGTFAFQSACSWVGAHAVSREELVHWLPKEIQAARLPYMRSIPP
jgi:hypothetical protein